MKNFYKFLVVFAVIAMVIMPYMEVNAGNKDRSGQAGAPELLINPWARGTGWGSANTSGVIGLEAMFSNVSGLAFTNKTEIIFTHTTWLKGSDISINNFGFAQRLNESSVLGLSVMSMGFGDLDVTTVEQPEGTGATFSPNLLNINLAMAKSFSNSISAGINLKIISQTIPDASAVGIALDVGVTYVTGERDQVKFGVALKNIGPEMKFTGDGFSIKAFFQGDDYSMSVYQRSEKFELPAQLRIGASYDFMMAEIFRLTLAGTFVSNSFTKDQFVGGLEFSINEYLMIRGGYTYENAINDNIEQTDRTNIYNGPSMGVSVDIPFNKESRTGLSIDYSYQTTAHFSGTHVFGVFIHL